MKAALGWYDDTDSCEVEREVEAIFAKFKKGSSRAVCREAGPGYNV